MSDRNLSRARPRPVPGTMPDSSRRSIVTASGRPRARRSRPAAHPGRRLGFLFLAWFVAFGIVGVRLVGLQAQSGDRWVELGRNQRIRTKVLPAHRGAVLDRRGEVLAMSITGHRVVADPTMVKDKAGAAGDVARVLRLETATVRRQLERPARYAVLSKSVDDDTAERVRKLGLAGIVVEDEPLRVNPAGETARAVIGRVRKGAEHVGISGMEMVLDPRLTGTPGEMLLEVDPGGKEIPAGESSLKPPRTGRSVELTIDLALQFEVERLLANQIRATTAKSGMVLVTEPSTGDILVLAVMVATKDGRVVPSTSNDALVAVFEPGSVNKVITIAAALEEGVMGAADTIGVPDRLQVADHNFSDDERHPVLAWRMSDIVAHSSNVGTIMIARRLGKERVDSYLRAFGFGRATSIDFPGESAGILLPTSKWSGTSIGTVPIGQGIAVTALQMLNAYNILANDGVNVPARLVRAEINGNGTRDERPAVHATRVVSASTAISVRAMLGEAVRAGTGAAAAIQGYSVAGKTGTARKPSPNARGYIEGAYVASFAGMVPADRPRLSAIVILDEPYPIYGGLVAAPLFASVMKVALTHLRVPPSPVEAAGGGGTTVPDPVAVAMTTSTTSPARDRVIDGDGGRRNPDGDHRPKPSTTSASRSANGASAVDTRDANTRDANTRDANPRDAKAAKARAGSGAQPTDPSDPANGSGRDSPRPQPRVRARTSPPEPALAPDGGDQTSAERQPVDPARPGADNAVVLARSGPITSVESTSDGA